MAAFKESVDDGRTDIWRYARLYDPPVGEAYRLTLGEGWTPGLELPGLARELGLERLVFKREDLNPTGSHKARSLAYQISKLLEDGSGVALISSSGNAAVAAAAYARLAGVRLFTFVSPRTNPVKLREIGRLGATVILTDKPINMAKYASRTYGIENLRPSVNDSSIEGFKSIGFEIFETLGDIDAVFTFASSGSSFIGIHRAYQLLAGAVSAEIPALYPVHAGALSDEGAAFGERSSSLAGNLGVKKTRRARAVLAGARSTGGEEMLATDEAILKAAGLLASHGILTSAEGVASFSALMGKAAEGRFRRAVCILTGHSSQWPDEDAPDLDIIDSEEALGKVIERALSLDKFGGRP